MPRNGSGTYSLPAGNPVVAGDVIEASWANTTLSDVANELTNSLSRNGNGGMLAPFRVADGSVSAPGLGFTNETNTGLYRAGSGEIWLTVGGIAVAQLTVNGMLIPAGKRITLPAPVNDTDATNKEYVDDLVAPVIGYADFYLGPKSSDPLVNNSGGALTAGTTYWSTTLDQMRVYNGTNWEPMPSTSSLVGQTFSGTGAQTAFTMANPSGPAVNLEVFISGVRQVPTTDYTVSNNILTFTSAPPVGTNNIFIRYAQLMQSSGNLQTVVQNITATAGQTAFSLSSSYQPGTNNLGVYVNGLRLVPGTDYTETSSTTLTMASGATAGDEFMFVIGDEISESISSVNVSYTPAGTGAVPTSVQTKLRESVSAKDFGSAGGTAEVQLASNSLSVGLVGITPGTSWTPSTIIPKQNITYQQGQRFYSVAKANGEQFYSPSGETLFANSVDVVEASISATGSDFTPSTTYNAIKFTTASDASFIQAIELRLKKSGGVLNTDFLAFALYTNVAGAPGVQISSGGQITGAQLTASYQSVYAVLQNVTTSLTPSTTYWVVITRSITAGAIVIDSGAGSGSFYAGAALGALSDAGSAAYYKVYARSEYPLHTVGKFTHGAWIVSIAGVGVRGDSTAHYGGYFQSVADIGVRGQSTNRAGVYGASTYGDGVQGEASYTAAYGVFGNQTAVSGGYPGVYGKSVSGPGVIGYTTSTDAHVGDIRALGGKFTLGGQQWNSGTAAPGSGQWYQGDIIWNSAPTAGGTLGWVCTTTGVPGVWKTFGGIAP